MLEELEMVVIEALVGALVEPPVSTAVEKIRALATMEHLLQHFDGPGTPHDGYSFADALMDDSDALWSLQELVPYGEVEPEDPLERRLMQAAQRSLLLAAGERDQQDVVWSAEQRIPLTEGEMLLWSVTEERGLTIDVTADFIPAAGPPSIYDPKDAPDAEVSKSTEKEKEPEPEPVAERQRVPSSLGVFTADCDGELRLSFGNGFSWLRHKSIRTMVFKQDEWDFDPGAGMEDEPLAPQQLQVAAGALRGAITKRDLKRVSAIIGNPEAEQSHRTMLARLYWDPAKRFTLLHLAAVQNAVPFAQLLLREGAPPNAQAVPHGFTPLFLAASHGFLELAQLLLKAGADFEIPATRPPPKVRQAVRGPAAQLGLLLC